MLIASPEKGSALCRMPCHHQEPCNPTSPNHRWKPTYTHTEVPSAEHGHSCSRREGDTVRCERAHNHRLNLYLSHSKINHHLSITTANRNRNRNLYLNFKLLSPYGRSSNLPFRQRAYGVQASQQTQQARFQQSARYQACPHNKPNECL